MATMKSVLLMVLLASLLAAAASVSLPRPHLQVDYAATVLHLQCSPPTEAAGTWSKILAVAVSQRDTHRNATVMSIAYGQTDPLLGEFLQGRSSAARALGSFGDKTIKLSALFPRTKETTFTCDFSYLLNDHMNSFQFSRTLDVTPSQGGEFRNYDFEYRTIHAHKVSIEWSSSNLPQYGQLTVSRIPLGREGQQVGAQQILLALEAGRGALSTEDVIIVDFKPTSAVGNASLTVFVASSTCSYDCYIPHNHCYDQDEKLCHCQSEDDRPACSVVEVYLILLCVFLALWILTLIATITLCCCVRCKRRKLFRKIVQFVKCNERPNAKASEEQPALTATEDTEEDPDMAEKKSDKERLYASASKVTDEKDTDAQLRVEIPNLKVIEAPDLGRGQRDSRRRRSLDVDSHPGHQPGNWQPGSLGSRRVDDGGPVADRNSGARPRSRTSETGLSPRGIPSRSVADCTVDPNNTRYYPGSRSASANGSNESHLDTCSKRSLQGSTESALNPESLKRSLNTDVRDLHNPYSATLSTPIIGRPTPIIGNGETSSDHALRVKH